MHGVIIVNYVDTASCLAIRGSITRCTWKNRTGIITNDNAVRDNERTGDNDERNRFMDYHRDILEKQ